MTENAPAADATPTRPPKSRRRRLGLGLAVAGFLLFVLGADPSLLGLSPVERIGFGQVSIFTFGLAWMTLGGSLALDSLWPPGSKTIAAEIGLRLAWTGFVIAMAAGMADVFGLGTRPFPSQTFFGYWQERGVLLGQIVIILGFLMMIPLRPPAARPTPEIQITPEQ